MTTRLHSAHYNAQRTFPDSQPGADATGGLTVLTKRREDKEGDIIWHGKGAVISDIWRISERYPL